MTCTTWWHVQHDDMYNMTCTTWWLYNIMTCTTWHVRHDMYNMMTVQHDMYNMMTCTTWWHVQHDDMYNMMTCATWWHVQHDDMYSIPQVACILLQNCIWVACHVCKWYSNQECHLNNHCTYSSDVRRVGEENNSSTNYRKIIIIMPWSPRILLFFEGISKPRISLIFLFKIFTHKVGDITKGH